MFYVLCESYERQTEKDWTDGRGFLKVLHLLFGTRGRNKNRTETIQSLYYTLCNGTYA